MVSPDQGWAAGNFYQTEGAWKGGTEGILLRCTDGAWAREDLPSIEGNWWLRKLYFTSPDEGWAVGSTGDKGLILHYSGGTWTVEALPANDWKEVDLYDIFVLPSGEAWAVGGARQKSAILLHRTGGVWGQTDLPDLLAKHTLVTIHGSSANDIWAGGFNEGEFGKVMMTGQPWGSFMIHWDGNAWTEASFPLLMRNIIMMDMMVFSPKEALFLGYNPPFQTARENGKMGIWNGKKWGAVKPPDVAHEWKLYDLGMKDASNGFACGEFLQRDHGLVLQCKKGEWAEVKEKKMPEVSGKWHFLTTDHDGSGTWWFAGWDEQHDKGIIYSMKD